MNIGHGSSSFVDETVYTESRTVLSFPEGNGVSLSQTTAVIDSGRYTIELLFRFHQIDGWRKIIDFKHGSDDAGLYSFDGRLNFYPTALAPRPTIAADTYAQVVLTRAASGKVTGFVNGVRQFSFRDVDELAVIDASDALRFFVDDTATGGEQSAGAVSRIRLYDGPSNASQVAVLACEEVPNAICGSDADDRISGTAGDDIILPGAGDDVIAGGGGNDVIVGHEGDDVMMGNDGDDLLLGGRGGDSLSGGAGDDVLMGQAGADTLAGAAGGDVLEGGAGPDRLLGGEGVDACSGGPGRDRPLGCERQRPGSPRVYAGPLGEAGGTARFELVKRVGRPLAMRSMGFEGVRLTCDIDGSVQVWGFGWEWRARWTGGLRELPGHALDLDDVGGMVVHIHGTINAVRGSGTLSIAVGLYTQDEQVQTCSSGELTWTVDRTVPPIESPAPPPAIQVLHFVTASGAHLTMTRLA